MRTDVRFMWKLAAASLQRPMVRSKIPRKEAGFRPSPPQQAPGQAPEQAPGRALLQGPQKSVQEG